MKVNKNIIKFKKGDTHQIHMAPSGFYKIHILEVIDECYVVYKWYGRHKRWWHYEIESEYILNIIIPEIKGEKKMPKYDWMSHESDFNRFDAQCHSANIVHVIMKIGIMN